MPAWKWSGPCARAIPARPPCCCWATCSPAPRATATRSVRIGPRPKTPRSARSRPIAAPGFWDDSGIRAPAKRSRASPKRMPATRPRRPRCTCPGTCSPTAATGRARRPLRLAAPPLPAPPPAVATSLARLDTLVLAGLDTAAEAEVRTVLGRAPQQDVDALLAWSDGLAVRGFGPAAVRLGWQAALKAPAAPRVLRAIFPWPNRPAVQAEAAEFGVDPLLFVAIVRQESVFDAEALSPAGARGLAQLTPGTAALTARGLDVTFYPDWITVPDLNLHLGAAHLDELLRRFGGRVDAAVAAYNAGVTPVTRWLARAATTDVDQFVELIPYQETRGYVRP